VHTKYYKEYDAKCRHKAKRHAAEPHDPVPIDVAPDVGHLLRDLKKTVLEGANIVFSGFFPLGVDVVDSDIGLLTSAFGAQPHRDITPLATHLVVSTQRPRTQKVVQASKMPYIKIVNQHWLYDCMSQWKWLDERNYLIKVSAPTNSSRHRLSTIDADGHQRDLAVDEAEDAKGGEGGDGGEGANGDGDDDDEASDPLQEFDWDEVDDELKELLSGEDDEDEDGDGGGDGDDEDEDEDDKDSDFDVDADADVSSEDKDENDGGDEARPTVRRTTPMRGTKRKATDEGDESDDGSGTPSPGSLRKRRPGQEGEARRTELLLRGASSKPPTEDVEVGDAQNEDDGDDDDDDDGELEAALLAEFDEVESEEDA
jgi:RNA polymerase II subunit A-like phosphatase